MKHKFIDILLLTLSFVGAIFTGALIMDESLLERWISLSDAKRQPVGIVRTIGKDVRRKMKSSFVWGKVKDETLVYNKDSIFTGDGAHAEIALYNGMVLKLKENSLVTIDLNDLGAAVDLRLGDLVTDFSDQQQITLLSDGKRTDLKGVGGVRISRSDKDLTVKANTNGRVNLLINGTNKVLSETEILKIGKSLKSERLNFSLKFPAKGGVLWGKEYREIDFKWKSDKKVSGTMVIAEDKSFNNIIYRKNVQSLTHSEKVRLFWKEQTYFWKIISNNNKKNYDVEKFSVAYQEPPQLIFPLTQTEFLLNEKTASTLDLRLKWRKRFSVDEYRVQLATDRGFKDLVEDEIVMKDSFDIRTGLGEYYWRVSALGNVPINEMWSESAKFQVIERWRKFKSVPLGKFVGPPLDHYRPYLKPIKVEDKLLLSKEDQKKEIILKVLPVSSREPASINKAIQNPPTLRWEEVRYAKSYYLEIAKDQEFKEKVLQKEIGIPKYKWDNVRTGKYFWRVQKIDEVGTKGKWGDLGELNIRLEAPVFVENKIKRNFSTKSFDSFNTAASEVGITWFENPLAASYAVEWSKDNSFSQKKNRTVAKPNIKLLLPIKRNKEEFVFRVAAMNSKGKIISDYSTISKVHLKKELLLKRPALSIPSNNSTVLTLNGPTPPILFLWNAVNGAEKYQLQVSSDGNFEKKSKDIKIEKSQVLLKEGLEKGIQYWRVRAKHSEFLSPWSKVQKFNIN